MGRDAHTCEARALHTRGSRLPKTSENDCFAVYMLAIPQLQGKTERYLRRKLNFWLFLSTQVNFGFFPF